MTIRPTSGLGRVLQALIIASAVTTLAVYAWGYVRLRDGTFVLPLPDPEGPPTFRTGRPVVGGILYLPGTVATVAEIVWLFWQHRATENLWARRYDGLRIRPGWAVGWWLIPVANLFMPCVAMLELDRRSTPDGRPRRASPLIGVWWAAWVIYSIVPSVGLVIAANEPIRDVLSHLDQRSTEIDLTNVAHAVAPWALIAAFLFALTGALAVAVVRRIDAAQDALLEAPDGWLIPIPARPDAIA